MTIKNISSIALNPLNHKQYIITMTDKIAPGEAPKLGYTKGDVTAVDGGVLQNILDFLVTNNAVAVIPHLVSATTNSAGTQVILTFDTEMASVTGKQAEFGVGTVSLYQKWTNGLPDSPELTSDYPYQFVGTLGSNNTIYLLLSKTKIYTDGSGFLVCVDTSASKLIRYNLSGGLTGSWTNKIDTTGLAQGLSDKQANNDVYTDVSYTSVWLAKTASILSPLPLSAAALDTDPKKVILSLNIAGEYQKWSDVNYGGSTTVNNSPVKTTDYPYQVLYFKYIECQWQLACSDHPFYRDTATECLCVANPSKLKIYKFPTNWTNMVDNATFTGVNTGYNPYTIDYVQCNNNIYTDSSLTTIWKTKTTPATASAITSGQTVKTSYTKGTVQSATGGALESYADQPVTNAVP